MKTLTYFLLFLILPLNIFSQEDKPDESLDIHINPWTVIDYTPRIRLGLEYNNVSKLSYTCDFGFGNASLNDLRINNINISNYVFFEIRPELKYNFYEINHLSLYCSIEGFYINMLQTIKNSSYGSLSNEEVFFDSARYKKQKFGSHLKVGLHSFPFKRLTFDFYFGLGVAKRIIDYSNVTNAVYTNQPLFTEWFPSSSLYEGSSTLLHITAGVKFGLMIWEK